VSSPVREVPAGDPAVSVDALTVHAFDIPVDGPDGREQDGTLTWESVTMIVVEARAHGQAGLGYTYGDVATAALIESKLTQAVRGADAMAPPAAQVGLSGHCAPAVSAHAFCAVPHPEYFHTHVRAEGIAFDGTLSPAGRGAAPRPGTSRPGA